MITQCQSCKSPMLIGWLITESGPVPGFGTCQNCLTRGQQLSALKQTRNDMALHIAEGIFGVVTQVMYGPPSFLIARMYAHVLMTQLALLKTIDDVIRSVEN